MFGSRETGYYLRKFAWTKIVRHQLVAGTASPDDPCLVEYWARRRRRSNPSVARAILSLLQAQHGRCPLCRELLLLADSEPQSPREWEQWLLVIRKALRRQALNATPDPGNADDPAVIRLIHTHCLSRLARAG